ncbi:reticulocyte binding protein, putative, partial [Plasmodium berghei]
MYDISGTNESLKFFYAKLYYYQELRTFLNNIYSNSKKAINIRRSTPLKIDNDINRIIKECEPHKTKVINEMSKLHNPFYEFYKKPTKDDYNPYSNFRKSYVNCMLPRFKNLEPNLNSAISSMKSEYDHLCYYEYWNVDALYKKYADSTTTYMFSQFNILDNYVTSNAIQIISHLKSLNRILESEGEQESLISKLKFLSNQIEYTVKKFHNYKKDCIDHCYFMSNYLSKNTYTQYYYNYLREIKKIAQQKANFAYNSNKLKHLNLLYIHQKGILKTFYKAIEKILLEKLDPDKNKESKDYIGIFDYSIPQSKLTELETKFFEIFKEKWDSYDNKKTIDENSNEYNIVKLILQHMKELKDIIDFMVDYKKKDTTTRFEIGHNIKWYIDQVFYSDIENGVKKSYKSVKDWRKLRLEEKKKLEEENENVIKLETKINDLFEKYMKINAENIYL